MVDQLTPATDQAVATAEPVVATPVVEQAPVVAAPVEQPVSAPTAPAPRAPINAQAAQTAAPVVNIPVFRDRADGAEPLNVANFKKLPTIDQGQVQPAPIVQSPAAPQAPDNGVVPPAQPAPIETPAAQATAPLDWEALTGGQIKTQSDWETFQSEQQRLADQVRTLIESRVEFANPLVAKLNDVFKNGGDMATAASVIKAQNLDPASMKPLEAIKASISFQHPNLDAEEVEAHIESMGINLSDMEGAGTRAALKVHSEKASQYLNSLKVQMDNPQVLVAAQEAAAAQARNEELWKTAPTPPTVTKISENVGGVVVATEFAHSPEALAYAAQVSSHMKTMPKNDQNVQNYIQLHQMLARAYDTDRLIAHVTSEAVRVAKLEAAKANAGPAPTPVPQAAPPPPSQARPQGHFALSGT